MKNRHLYNRILILLLILGALLATSSQIGGVRASQSCLDCGRLEDACSDNEGVLSISICTDLVAEVTCALINPNTNEFAAECRDQGGAIAADSTTVFTCRKLCL
jgi:hypothetical protein